MAINDNSLENIDRNMNFNSNIAFGSDGKMIAHYRKHFLYMIDESWCVEGSERFYAGNYPAPVNKRVAMGICMDINPYQFKAPWDAMEFANHVLDSGAELVILSMAWTNLDASAEEVSDSSINTQPDWQTIRYWMSRFHPVIQANKTVHIVFGNRCGVEHDVVFVGTSTIARVGCGKVEVWEIAGIGEERLLVVDTNTKPKIIWNFQADKFQTNDQDTT